MCNTQVPNSNGGRVYLSTNSDGTVVDLYGSVTPEGNQAWKLTARYGDVVSIKTLGQPSERGVHRLVQHLEREELRVKAQARSRSR